MHAIIDVPSDVGKHAVKLADAGVRTVIRYYNHRNSQILPSKCLSKPELEALTAAGLSVATVFQQRGGSGGNIADLSAEAGKRDATRAVALAESLGQPQGSAIYFAVDWDYYKATDLQQIERYFAEAAKVIGGRYRIGSYGSGAVGRRVRDAGHAQLMWLAGATGWAGTSQALADGSWALFQKHLEVISPVGGFVYDGNIVNPAHADFGQFTLGAAVSTKAAPVALYEVTARSGLNVRAGPGESFRVLSQLPFGAMVSARGQAGPWMELDLQGDGAMDGFGHGAFLRLVSGGLPLPTDLSPTPYDIARAELAFDVREVPGAGSNPRIVMYHATTSDGAESDGVAWCSSFVNYCVEQAGLVGTDSKWARSWHDNGWGRDVTKSAREGDIVVWRREGATTKGGHVGFFVSEDDDSIEVLGGNQSNRVRLQRYPKAGKMGAFTYTLLSIRRR
jgi:uncharacterized protein (TIGR02594 family)